MQKSLEIKTRLFHVPYASIYIKEQFLLRGHSHAEIFRIPPHHLGEMPGVWIKSGIKVVVIVLFLVPKLHHSLDREFWLTGTYNIFSIKCKRAGFEEVIEGQVLRGKIKE